MIYDRGSHNFSPPLEKTTKTAVSYERGIFSPFLLFFFFFFLNKLERCTTTGYSGLRSLRAYLRLFFVVPPLEEEEVSIDAVLDPGRQVVNFLQDGSPFTCALDPGD